jgi:hypothetical protein
MKKLVLLLCILSTHSVLAASVTVEQFNLDFLMDTSEYEVDFELTMACRYEKFVISDSSEYEYTYKKVPLKITKKKLDRNTSRVRVSNTRDQKLVLKGMFKSNKECQTYLEFFFKSKKYSVGWANQFDRPIRLGVFEHSRLAEYKTFDINALRDTFENKLVSFIYKPVSSQVNVRLGFDNLPSRGMSSYLSMSTAIDKNTNMPYRLKK